MAQRHMRRALPLQSRALLSAGRQRRSTSCAAPISRSGRARSVALVAPSGAGKSTPAACRRPARAAGRRRGLRRRASRPHSSTTRRARALRRTEIGFVYQFHHLLPEFSALENVMLPQMHPRPRRRRRPRERAERAPDLPRPRPARSTHRPAELSGGEQQRVAIARAVANAPRAAAGRRADRQSRPAHAPTHVFATLTALVRASGLAALIATHNMDLARPAWTGA